MFVSIYFSSTNLGQKIGQTHVAVSIQPRPSWSGVKDQHLASHHDPDEMLPVIQRCPCDPLKDPSRFPGLFPKKTKTSPPSGHIALGLDLLLCPKKRSHDFHVRSAPSLGRFGFVPASSMTRERQTLSADGFKAKAKLEPQQIFP